jgi:hypothetical protein
MTDRLILTTSEVPYPYYGMRSYRIEIDLSERHHPLQRHIWTREDGTVDVQEWIRTIPETKEGALQRGYRVIQPA